jgi:hypothetical protein
MKLTVGPLPPAVYWRRRVVVVGTLLLLMIALLYSCFGGKSNVSLRKGGQSTTTMTPSSSSSASSMSPSPSPPVFTGGGIAAQADGDGGDPQPSASPTPSEPAAPATGPCNDGEMTVIASPAQPSVARGSFVRFYLRIKNISGRSCTRDVGADAQELYMQDASKAKVWSSDACDPRHGNDVRTFNPGDQAEFFLDWDGKASNAGCDPGKRQAPAAGRYELIGRLATKLSDPAAVELK